MTRLGGDLDRPGAVAMDGSPSWRRRTGRPRRPPRPGARGARRRRRATEELEPHRVTSSPARAAGGGRGALDVAQALGPLAEGGGNLGASTRSAALARPWSSRARCSRSAALDPRMPRLGGDLDPARRGGRLADRGGGAGAAVVLAGAVLEVLALEPDQLASSGARA
ncbi:MAG TPA: hypothetical protein VHT91_14170, partial [Kofleriaceae bacterium]|nr:hypothetical protein [Kofleriaceae bacterium]